MLGVIEGFLILIAILLILDPHFNQPLVRETATGFGEFGAAADPPRVPRLRR